MADDQLTSDPPTVVYAGDRKTPMKAKNVLTNKGTTKLTVKVKVNNPAINVARPFMMIEPGESASMYSKCQLPEGADPNQAMAVAVLYADAPADLKSDVASLKTAWATLQGFKTLRLTVEIKPGEAPAAPAEGGGEAAPAEDGEAASAE